MNAHANRRYIHEGLTAARPVHAGVWTLAEHPSERLHIHDNLELLWTRGAQRLRIDAITHEVAKPALWIIPALTPHLSTPFDAARSGTAPGVSARHAAASGGAYLAILETAFDPERTRTVFRAGPVHPEHTARVLPLAEFLHARLCETGGGITPDLRQIAQGVLGLLGDLGYRGGQRLDRNLDPVQRALAVLYQRYSDSNLLIDDLADAAGLSIAQFRRVFRQVTGEAPLGYLTRHRLEQARLLLEQNMLTVEAVAHRVGFDSPGSFYKRFRELYGQSPRGYQRSPTIDEAARTWAPPGTYARPDEKARGARE